MKLECMSTIQNEAQGLFHEVQHRITVLFFVLWNYGSRSSLPSQATDTRQEAHYTSIVQLLVPHNLIKNSDNISNLVMTTFNFDVWWATVNTLCRLV